MLRKLRLRQKNNFLIKKKTGKRPSCQTLSKAFEISTKTHLSHHQQNCCQKQFEFHELLTEVEQILSQVTWLGSSKKFVTEKIVKRGFVDYYFKNLTKNWQQANWAIIFSQVIFFLVNWDQKYNQKLHHVEYYHGK